MMNDVVTIGPRSREELQAAKAATGGGLRTAALAAALSAALLSEAAAADAVTDWNEIAGEAAKAACITPDLDPLHESRMYAMMHIAIHDALNSIDRRSRPYVLWAEAPAQASPDAAVAKAARDVLHEVLGENTELFAACIDAARAVVESSYADKIAGLPAGEGTEQGIEIGRTAAAAILNVRAGDGSDAPLINLAYPQGSGPGEYRFTPGTPFVFGSEWGNVRPFALRRSTQFRPDRPFEVSCDNGERSASSPGGELDSPGAVALLPFHRRDCERFAADFNEVKAYGGGGAGDPTPSARNDEQTEVALFWVGSAPLQWNMIARTLSARHDLDSWENARLFALVNIAMADGYIASFATKYHYDYWRPITAIQEAHLDGNPNTEADPTWAPLVPTPPLPDYESAHSVEGAAAATAMQRFFAADLAAFETCSISHPDLTKRCGGADEVRRSYLSLSQAAEENAVSRILVGFHFRDAIEKGLEHGRNIGDWTFERVLRPMD